MEKKFVIVNETLPSGRLSEERFLIDVFQQCFGTLHKGMFWQGKKGAAILFYFKCFSFCVHVLFYILWNMEVVEITAQTTKNK